MTETTIYVRLIDEAVDVWRPVRAVHVERDKYLIAEQPYDRDLETWEFSPGDSVVGKSIDLDGQLTLVAVRRAGE